MDDLVFLKLGGSLITEKNQPHTARPEVLDRLAQEIAQAQRSHPGLRLVLGHGSGSFGHVPAQRHATRQGVQTAEQWVGFVEVWREASALNHLVMVALAAAGLPAIALAPSASVQAHAGQVRFWDLRPLSSALEAGLLPVVYGDVVFDSARGGTILSTEDLFEHLALALQPRRLLLAGIEAGVWADYPACTRLVPEITPGNFLEVERGLGGSAATDVTGGMASKVAASLRLAETVSHLEVRIFSGAEPGQVAAALDGSPVGTLIRA